VSDDRSGCVHEPVRSVLRFEALVVLAVLVVLYGRTHASWVLFSVLLLVPDVGILGYVRGSRLGAWSYNAFHTYAAPALCLEASLYFPPLLPISIVWAAHIAMDRAFGYGLKYADEFGHTHLCIVGNKRR
jgi:hypothetical protein